MLKNAMRILKALNKKFNSPIKYLSHKIVLPRVEYMSHKLDYKLLSPLKYFLGVFIVGPIAGIASSLRWAEQLAMIITLCSLVTLGTPLLSVLALTLRAGILTGVVRSFAGILFNNIYSYCNPNLRLRLRTPLAAGFKGGIVYANAVSSSNKKNNCPYDDNNEIKTYSDDAKEAVVIFGATLNIMPLVSHIRGLSKK